MRHAVILAGGAGTRLWPLSRPERPKPLLALGGPDTLLARTAARIAPLCSGGVRVVTEARLAPLLRSAEPDLELLIEPAARGTAAAIGLAAAVLAASDPRAVLAVLPSDHHIPDTEAFRAAASLALERAESADGIAILGISPSRPDTGYGYVRVGPGEGAVPVLEFIEKPEAGRAQRLVEGGDALWNAGMFFARASWILHELDRLAPATGALCRRIEAGETLEAVTSEYHRLDGRSFDHAVMEATSPVWAIRAGFSWSDLGSFDSLADALALGDDGNVSSGSVHLRDCRDCVIINDGPGTLAVVGLDSMVVATHGGDVLVVPKDRAQDVRWVVASLRERDA